MPNLSGLLHVLVDVPRPDDAVTAQGCLLPFQYRVSGPVMGRRLGHASTSRASGGAPRLCQSRVRHRAGGTQHEAAAVPVALCKHCAGAGRVVSNRLTFFNQLLRVASCHGFCPCLRDYLPLPLLSLLSLLSWISLLPVCGARGCVVCVVNLAIDCAECASRMARLQAKGRPSHPLRANARHQDAVPAHGGARVRAAWCEPTDMPAVRAVLAPC